MISLSQMNQYIKKILNSYFWLLKMKQDFPNMDVVVKNQREYVEQYQKFWIYEAFKK